MSKRKNKHVAGNEYGNIMEGLFKGAVIGTAVVTAAVVGGGIILGKIIKDKIEESSSHDNNQINVQPDTLLIGEAAGDDFCNVDG